MTYEATIIQSILNQGDIIQNGGVFSFFQSEQKVARVDRRELGRRLKKLQEKSQKLYQYLVEEYQVSRKKKFIYEVARIDMRDTSLLRKLKEEAIQRGEVFFTEFEVLRTLERFGLGGFRKYVHQDDFLDFDDSIVRQEQSKSQVAAHFFPVNWLNGAYTRLAKYFSRIF